MRVDAGKLKGRKLVDNKFEHIRPTADIVKQSMFNKLSYKLQDARVLDLFCGTGALGIEAYSRGAKEVVFVDADERSVKLTKENLKALNIKENVKVFLCDYKRAVKKLQSQFDIIILDPPYKSGIYEDAIKVIFENKLLADDGIIICEHDKKSQYDFSPFEIDGEKVYGTKMLTFLRY